MIQSPFTYYGGAALAMAVDLASLPATGVHVQVCGDVHLGNFRVFATPERRVIFDIHDLDETLPAPWEWDVKRLATGFVIAARNNGLSDKRAKEAVLACVRSYREHMAEFSEMRALDVWYHSLDADTLLDEIEDAETRKCAKKRLTKVKALSALDYDFPKLVDVQPDDERLLASGSTVTRFHHAYTRCQAELPVEERPVLREVDAAQTQRLQILNNYLPELFLRTRRRQPLYLILAIDPSDDPTHGQQVLSFFHGYFDPYQYFPPIASVPTA